jgi:hypothetical protein
LAASLLHIDVSGKSFATRPRLGGLRRSFANTQYSDAFYLYTDFNGNRITPVHPILYYNWVLWINGQHAENLIPSQQVPAYQPDGEYTFQINAPGGHLTFGVGDVGTGDNEGGYTIHIGSPSSDAIPYFSQIDPQWATHELQTNGSCSPECGTIGACGCTLTSAAMLFAYYGANLTPLTLSDCMGTNACMFDFRYASSDCSDGQATWDKLYGFDWGRLDREINQNGHPVILEMYRERDNETDTHWVLVTSGHGNNAEGYLVHDPSVENGANRKLSPFQRAGYIPNRIAVYNGQPGLNLVPLRYNKLVDPAQTGWSARYRFKETIATAIPSAVTSTPTPIPTSPIKLRSTTPVADSISALSISATISIYYREETTLIVRLSATSTSGDIVEMQVWTDSGPAPQWQPFDTFTWVPWQPEDDRVYVRFRDEFGNVSSDFSTSIFPEFSPPLERQMYLPIILKSY